MVQGVPEKSTFLEFQVLDRFGRLWTYLAVSDHKGLFGQLWAIWDHFDCFDHFGLYGQFWTVTNHAGAFERSRTVHNGPKPEISEKCFFSGTPCMAEARLIFNSLGPNTEKEEGYFPFLKGYN